MRKQIIWVIGALVILCIVGLTVYQTNATTSNPELKPEQIIDLVDVQYPGQHSEPELSIENGEPVYQMKVTQDQGVYSLKLNGDTGQVIDLTAIEKTANNQEEDKEKQEEVKKEENPAEENPEADDPEPAEENAEDKSDNQTAENDAMLTHEEVREIALKEFPGEVTDLELDSDDGVYIYEIEIVNGEDEASIEIDAYTGKVVMIEIDRDD
ncbi:PepSY domain-containing protein [Oceanobacillus sp. CFH 90083]|uniref:PepSY domain-containing protein n=1 Tax=Oceanobacillus sp. CFH 90083 TaxID=2592336 RepID=UPI00128E5404|nr:PepSY domain-containing protein [Oceanobacillus sp. CFH 90083]